MESLTEEATSIEGPLWIASRPHEVLRLTIAGSRASLTAVDFWLANAPEHAWDDITRWRRIRTKRDWDPDYGDRQNSLVILTVDPGSAHRVHQTLEFAALNDTELGAGFEAWALLEDPFTALLGDPATAHPEAATAEEPRNSVREGALGFAQTQASLPVRSLADPR